MNFLDRNHDGKVNLSDLTANTSGQQQQGGMLGGFQQMAGGQQQQQGGFVQGLGQQFLGGQQTSNNGGMLGGLMGQQQQQQGLGGFTSMLPGQQQTAYSGIQDQINNRISGGNPIMNAGLRYEENKYLNGGQQKQGGLGGFF